MREFAKSQQRKASWITDRFIQQTDDSIKTIREIIGPEFELVMLGPKLARRFCCADQFGIIRSETD